MKRDGRLVEEVYRDRRPLRRGRSPRSSRTSRRRFRTRPSRWRTRCARSITFYRTGEEADREAYDIAWVQDKASPVDTINGFVEVYLDARGIKGAWEALVFYVNREKTVADPDDRRARAVVRGPHAVGPEVPQGRRRTASPPTPSTSSSKRATRGRSRRSASTCRTIRRSASSYGSKSVSLVERQRGVRQVDAAGVPQRVLVDARGSRARATKWSAFAGELTTNMHEVIGHGSGKVDERLNGNPQAALKEQFSALEESRADLVALYFLPDPKLVELGLVPADDHDEIVRAEYESYTRNALVQLRRVREGTQIEEDHMRNRQMIVHWLMAQHHGDRRADARRQDVLRDDRSDGVPRRRRPAARRGAAHQGRRRLRRGARAVRAYGVHFDPELRDEVVARVDHLQLPSYTGFVMPKLDAGHGRGRRRSPTSTISYPLDLDDADARVLGGDARTSSLRRAERRNARMHACKNRRRAQDAERVASRRILAFLHVCIVHSPAVAASVGADTPRRPAGRGSPRADARAISRSSDPARAAAIRRRRASACARSAGSNARRSSPTSSVLLRHPLPEVRAEAANAIGQAAQGWKREKPASARGRFDADARSSRG